MTNVLDNELREKIFNLVQKNPGLHLSKIAELMSIRISHAEYHLLYLERRGLLLSLKEKGEYQRRYYSYDCEIGTQEKKILAVFRQEKLLRIIIILLKKQRIRQKDLIQDFNRPSPTISYYISKLIEMGLVISITQGDEKGYSLVDRKLILKMLLKFQMHTLLDDFEEIWDELEYY